MKRSGSFFVYSWHLDESEREVTKIRAYGLNLKNETVCVHIDDFTPFVYLELPSNVEWDDTRAKIVVDKIDEIMGSQRPLKKSLVFKKKLFFAYLDKKNHERLDFPFLFLAFSSKNDIQSLIFKLKKGFAVQKLGIAIQGKIHEHNASPILQVTSVCKIPTAGWIKFVGVKIESDAKETHCAHEYTVKYKCLSAPGEEDEILSKVVKPLIMIYDLEVYSSNPNKMPTSSKPKDVIFQISCVFARNGEKEEQYEKYLLSLGEPDPDVVGEGVNIYGYENEYLLLAGFVDLIHEFQPSIICGYNIFKFDIPYMIDRAKLHSSFDILQKHGFHKYSRAEEKTIKWSSTAFKDQEFQYLDAEGRLYVDLLPLVQRDYKMSNYTLKTISTHFLGETKDPLTPKGIFKCYKMGMDRSLGQKSSKAMGIVGKYCVQDSVLVMKLFDKLQTWFSLTEMAAVCHVPIFAIYTQGQQIKVFSQVYKKCMHLDFIVQKDAYTVKPGEEHYQGALVYEPTPGVYDMVISHDFSSLYPSIMIAYNLDFSTLLPDDSPIPDSFCNVIEFEEHQGCEHDKSIRKSKPKFILCAKKKYKFLKTHKGILPGMVEDLLAARKKTRKQIKELQEKKSTLSDPDEINNIQILLNVLDKRQLSFKVSANSSYGSTGVQKGMLPCMPVAASITAYGRQSIMKVFDVIRSKYGAEIILSDTDSVYSVFKHLGRDTRALWEYAEKISDDISAMFPPPMRLEFEGFIYWRLLTLTKKRYISLKCDKEGTVCPNLEKKGVILQRRDNSKFVRDVYQKMVMNIFNRVDKDEVLDQIVEDANLMYANVINAKDYIITKSVGDCGHGAASIEPVPGKPTKVKLGGYTVPKLVADGKKRADQLLLKNATTEDEYYERCLPAQVQLAMKVRRRGGIVDTGSRIEFVILEGPSQGMKKEKLYEACESFEYYKENLSVLRIDRMYYMKALVNCLDQVLECTLHVEDFVLKQLKLRQQKKKVLAQLMKLFEPKLEFVE
jgi:DNA polymerase elongation subunit (family B)